MLGAPVGDAAGCVSQHLPAGDNAQAEVLATSPTRRMLSISIASGAGERRPSGDISVRPYQRASGSIAAGAAPRQQH